MGLLERTRPDLARRSDEPRRGLPRRPEPKPDGRPEWLRRASAKDLTEAYGS